MRVGFGYDVHKLIEGRKLILGGINIPFDKGLEGHSDADVITHAIMDALLGAVGMGDIGEHFPDSDEKYKDADSLQLLKRVCEIVEESGYYIENIDATIVAQKPKLKEYKEDIRENIAKTIKIDKSRVNIKATTEEGLGFTGSLDGISAKAICLVNEMTEINVYSSEESNSGCGGCCCSNRH